jgi:fibronectin type 3 domain-containing protein
MKLTSLAALILLVSGCSYKDKLTQPETPKVDETLEVVDSASVRSISDMNSVAFEWRKVDDPRVVGYHFYRANMQKEGTKLKLIDTIENKYTTHYVDEDLEPNTKYVYKISSATKGEIESRTTNDYVVSTLPRMEGVSFIQAISNLPRQIKIIWRPHSNERVESYIIQRTTPQTSEWEKLKTVEGRLQAEYIDDNLDDNVIYHYRVLSVTFDDIKSLPSEIIKAQTKALPEGILGLNATKELPRKISLNWQSSESSDVTKYNIYRSSNATTSFDKIKSVNAQTLQFEDFINEDGKVYFYKISSIDKDGLESNLNVNYVMGSTLGKLNKPIITLAQIQGEKAILNWQSGDRRAVSYIIHKTIKESFFKTKTVKFEGINGLRFEDKDIVRGVEYSYSIQAVDKFGIESSTTNKTELVLPKLKETE